MPPVVQLYTSAVFGLKWKHRTRKSHRATWAQPHISPSYKSINRGILHANVLRLITYGSHISKSDRWSWPVHRGVPSGSQRQVYNHVYGNQIGHRIITGSHGAQDALPSLHRDTQNTHFFREDAKHTICFCLAVSFTQPFRRMTSGNTD